MLCLFVLTIPFLVYVVAKLKAEATRIEMEAELTCQTKVSEMTHLYYPSLFLSPSTHTHTVHTLFLFYVFPLLFPLSLSSLCVFLFQMQEAEVQFLREQNELQIKRAKDLSNIEVYNYHLCCHCTFNIKHITCTCMYYCIITLCQSIPIGV